MNPQPYETSVTNNDGVTIPVYRNVHYGASPNNEERREMVRVGRDSPSHVAVDNYNDTATVYPTPETTETQIEGAIKFMGSQNPKRIYVVLPREGNGKLNTQQQSGRFNPNYRRVNPYAKRGLDSYN